MQLAGFFACAEPRFYWLRHLAVHLKEKREPDKANRPLSERMSSWSLTCAVTVIILVNKHLIQDEAEQLGL